MTNIERGQPSRSHVTAPQDWGYRLGTDYWLLGAASGMVTAGNAHELSDYGWITTFTLAGAAGGADFISAADVGVPGLIHLSAAGHIIDSPAIFGDYAHARAVQAFLGRLPTTLVVEAYAAFAAAAADEDNSGFGFVEDGGSPATAADHLAMIVSDGSNFVLRSGAASDVGAAVDTDFHLWRIEITATGVEWFIDGVSQGSIALTADEFPVSFGANVRDTTGVNFLQIAWAHVWYA